MGFTMKIKFASIFTMIFVISELKYLNLRNLKKSEVTDFWNYTLNEIIQIYI